MRTDAVTKRRKKGERMLGKKTHTDVTGQARTYLAASADDRLDWSAPIGVLLFIFKVLLCFTHTRLFIAVCSSLSSSRHESAAAWR